MKIQKILPPIVILALAAGLAGCTSFDTRWQGAAGSDTNAAAPSGIEGTWAGTWQNTNNTHAGKLWAVLERKSDTNYTAWFHATWGSHSGGFKTPLAGQWQDGSYHFEGRKRIVGFLIKTHGTASATNLYSVYESVFDNGTFTLHRPQAGEEPGKK